MMKSSMRPLALAFLLAFAAPAAMAQEFAHPAPEAVTPAGEFASHQDHIAPQEHPEAKGDDHGDDPGETASDETPTPPVIVWAPAVALLAVAAVIFGVRKLAAWRGWNLKLLEAPTAQISEPEIRVFLLAVGYFCVTLGIWNGLEALLVPFGLVWVCLGIGLPPGSRRAAWAKAHPALATRVGFTIAFVVILMVEIDVAVRNRVWESSPHGWDLAVLAGVGLFDVLATLGVARSWARMVQRERIARVLRMAPGAPGGGEAPAEADLPPAPRVAPRLDLALYREETLPPLRIERTARVGQEANIIGRRPSRILYLYNFFAAETAAAKQTGAWRWFGPTYFLASPGDGAAEHAFTLDIARDVAPRLIATPEAFEERFAAARETPLAPGDPDLPAHLRPAGAYPQHTFLCTDHSWRHAVRRLLAHVDVVLVDACGYSSERAGLTWELGQLFNAKRVEQVVLLVDDDADQAALAGACDAAWQAMDPASPNNQARRPPLRMVRLSDRGLMNLLASAAIFAMLLDDGPSQDAQGGWIAASG